MSFGLSWKNWVGYAIDSGAESPYYTATASGAGGAAAPLHVIPLAGAESIKVNRNTLFSPTVEGVSPAPMKQSAGGITVGGSIPSCLIPGMWGGVGDGKLFDWAYNRVTLTCSDTTEEWQLPSATLWIKLATNNIIKKVIGAKVNSFTIENPEGAAYTTFSIDIIGREIVNVTTDPSNVTEGAVLHDLYEDFSDIPVPEYRTKDAGLAFGTIGSAEWASPWTGYDPDSMNWSVKVDNKHTEDGFRLDGTGLLRRLYSTGREVTGSIGRDLRSHTQYDNFLAGTEMALSLLLYRGTASTLITLPRIVYEEGDPVSEGTRETHNKQALTFRAMGAYSGTPVGIGSEIKITETV